MIVGERLRALREERNFSQGEIEKRTGLLVATFHGWKTGTPFQPLKRSKNSRELSKSQCTNCYTTAKSRRNCPVFGREKMTAKLPGAIQGKTPERSQNSAVC